MPEAGQEVVGTITAYGPWYYQFGMVMVAIAIPAVLTVGLIWLDRKVLKIFHPEDAGQ